MTLADSLMAAGGSDAAALGSIPRFVVTNVAEYYFHHEKEYWTLKEFPLPHPPFDHMWLEYRIPKYTHSKEVPFKSVEVPGHDLHFGAFLIPDGPGRWGLAGRMYSMVAQGRDRGKILPGRHIDGMRFSIGPSGNIDTVWIPVEQEGKDDHQVATELYIFHPILMAFSFANCRNIEVIDVRPPEKLQRARKKRGKSQRHPFKVINILPFGRVFRSSGRTVVSEDGKIDVVIRRGSYAKYGPKFDHGLLFGKYEGMFWRPAKMASGEQERTYEVKEP